MRVVMDAPRCRSRSFPLRPRAHPRHRFAQLLPAALLHSQLSLSLPSSFFPFHPALAAMSGMTGKERGGLKKKPAGKKGARGGDDDEVSVMSEDEAAATYQQEVAAKNAEGEDLSPEERQDQLVEQLAEKRSSTRQAALSKFIDQLQQTYDPDFVAQRLETLQMYLLNSVRKGDAPEVVLACRALTLVSLTLGAASETLVTSATPILRDHLKNSSKSNAGRASAAEALGFIHFIGAINDKDTIEAMAMLTDALKAPATLSEAIATACWEAWGLLATSLPTSRLAGAVSTEFLPTLIRFLDDESIEVKTAAGENIALLMEAKQTIEAEKAGESDEDPTKSMADEAAAEEHTEHAATAASAAAVSDESKMSDALGTESPPSGKRKRKIAKAGTTHSASAAAAAERESLISKLSSLATESNRYKARKDRAIQRKSFRDILRTVEVRPAHRRSADRSSLRIASVYPLSRLLTSARCVFCSSLSVCVFSLVTSPTRL